MKLKSYTLVYVDVHITGENRSILREVNERGSRFHKFVCSGRSVSSVERLFRVLKSKQRIANTLNLLPEAFFHFNLARLYRVVSSFIFVGIYHCHGFRERK